MRDRLKQAFDAVHAEEALKERTKAFVAQQTRGHARRRPALRPSLAAAFACLCLLFTGGYWLYFTPTATISIDINPSIELGVNRFNRVVSVEGYNADGVKLAGELSVQYADYMDALDQVLANDTVAALLDADGVLTITVVGPEGEQTTNMLAGVEACTANRKNAYCYACSPEEVDEAHAAGLSHGKYRAYLELQALAPDITIEEVQGMTMREIQELVQQLTGEEPATQTEHADEASSGHGHGQGGGRHGQ